MTGDRPSGIRTAAPAAKLDKVLTIAEVAKLAGWSRLRMWRHLRALNRELGGMLDNGSWLARFLVADRDGRGLA